MNIELPIEKLAAYIEEFRKETLVDNKEVNITELDIYVPALGKKAKVNWFIKKCNLPMVSITLSNGYSIKVAKNHILQSNGIDIFAKDIQKGTTLDHLTGEVTVADIVDISNEDCYDVSIPSPHLYYDANGLVHHNTIMTAGLSLLVEQYGRSVVIVPNTSLVTQTEEDYKNLGLDVGVYFGGRKECNHKHTICTWQSLNVLLKSSEGRSSKTEPSSFRLLKDPTDFIIDDLVDDVVAVIVDECFDGDSKVLTPSGYVPIKDIKEGDTVINYSETDKVFKEDTVVTLHTNLSKSSNEKMYELEFDTGAKIQVTGNHQFLTNLGWVRADELTQDHTIISTQE